MLTMWVFTAPRILSIPTNSTTRLKISATEFTCSRSPTLPRPYCYVSFRTSNQHSASHELAKINSKKAAIARTHQ